MVIDVKKAAENTGDLISEYFIAVADLLYRPNSSLKKILLDSDNQDQALLRKAIVHATISVLLGMTVARLVELPGAPPAVSMPPAIAVVVVWIIVGVVLHPALRLFKAKGSIAKTVAVLLLTASTLHLVSIPVLRVIGTFVTETEVTLDYSYTIYFGARGDLSRHLPGPLVLSDKARDQLVEETRERFIKEREPDKDGTIIPPLRSNLDALPMSANDRSRVNASQVDTKPNRTERLVLGEGAAYVLLIFWLAYYFVHCFYLSRGFSVVHEQSSARLFAFGIAAPFVLACCVAGTSAIFLFFD